MLFFKQFCICIFSVVILPFKLHVDGSCKDVCIAIDRYTLVCNKVVKHDLHDCHRTHSEIRTLRLNWFGLNQSDVGRGDFDVFDNLSQIFVEPSTTDGFSTRTVSEEEYEDPKLWTTYDVMWTFGKVLKVRLFSAFRKESCCSKWLSRMVLGHLIPSKMTMSWFRHCFTGFNLFCRVNMTAPPRWMILAWIESSDEFRGLMEDYCKFNNIKLARFKRHLKVRSLWPALLGAANDTQIIAKSASLPAYTRKRDKETNHSKVGSETGTTYDIYIKLTFALSAVSIVLLFSFLVTCYLYCISISTLKNVGGHNSKPHPTKKVTFKRKELMIPSQKKITTPENPFDPFQHQRTISVTNNNDYITKYPSKEKGLSNAKGTENDNKKFVEKLRMVLGLQKSNSMDNQYEEKERLVPHPFDTSDQNNNNTINHNFSNCAMPPDDDPTKYGAHSSAEIDANLSDEEELEQIFLDHLYNRMRTQTRYEYLSQFDKYGYACNHYNSERK